MLVINLKTGICMLNLITYLRALCLLNPSYKKLRVMIMLIIGRIYWNFDNDTVSLSWKNENSIFRDAL